MSLLVTFNGSNYIIPETNEVGWGSNLDAYFVAIAAGCLQKTGGLFTLSAETDFGSAFGLKSLYYKSRSANVASTGIVRLNNNSDAVSWRNFANSADLSLAVNASNQLTFNGTPIGGSGIFTASRAVVTDGSGDLTTAATTATEIGYVSGVTSAIQTQFTGKKAISTGTNYAFEVTNSAGNLTELMLTPNRAVTTDGNGLPSASATTTTELGYVSGVTSAIQTQINTKAPTASPTFTGTITTPLTASRALTTGASSELAVSATTATELGYVSGVTSAIQTQINGKYATSGGTLTGDTTYASSKGIFWTDSGTNTVKITAPTTISATYALKWPTAQGSSNQYLTNDGSGNLSWTNAAGTGTVNSGTQYQLAYYAASTNAVSGNSSLTTNAANQLLATSGTATAPSYAFTSDPATGVFLNAASQLGFATGGTVRLNLTTTELRSTVNLVAAGGTSSLGSSTDVWATGWIKKLRVQDSSSSSTTPGTNPIAFIAGGNAGVNTLSEIGFSYGGSAADTNVPVTVGYQLTSGSGFTKGDLVFCTRNVTTDTAPTEAFRIKADHSIVASGNIAFTTTSTQGIVGTTTNDSAAAGNVGEVISSLATGVTWPTTGTYGDLTSISLTAGDWMVCLSGYTSGNGGTSAWSSSQYGISTTSGNSSAGLVAGNNWIFVTPPTATGTVPLPLAAYRVSLASTTTHYFKFLASFTGTAGSSNARITAVRIR